MNEVIICKKCKTVMNKLPLVLCSLPPQYKYECPECKHIEIVCFVE